MVASAPAITPPQQTDGVRKDLRIMFSNLPVLVVQKIDITRSLIIARFRNLADAKKFVEASGQAGLEIDDTVK